MLRKLIALSLCVALCAPAITTGAQDDSALPLDQTFRSADRAIRFQYPAGWVIREVNGAITLASNEAALDQPVDQLQPDQMRAELNIITPADLEDTPLPITPGSIGSNAAFVLAHVIATTDIPRPGTSFLVKTCALAPTGSQAACAKWANTTNDVWLIAAEVNTNRVAMLTAFTASGGMSAHTATLSALAASIEYFSPDDLAVTRAALRNVWQTSLRRLPTDPAVTYYALPPDGTPPATGWPLLVLFTSGSGQMMLQRFAEIAYDTGVLLVIIPDTISANKSEQIVPNITAILADTRASYPVDPRGAVLHGFSAAGSLTTLYARDVPENVAGIVAENAPVIFMPAGEQSDVVYAFVYGELDGGINSINLEKIAALRAQGHTVWYDVVPGVGHVFTQRSIERVFELIRTLFPVQ
jgi:predicted esterase